MRSPANRRVSYSTTQTQNQDRKNVPGTCFRLRCFSADMPASLINDPEHWRDRAREKRALAERLRNEHAKQTVLYERLAEQAEEQSRGSPPKRTA
jgi:hypothetical protein